MHKRRGKCIVVTGSSGRIGNAIVDQLAKSDYFLIGVDKVNGDNSNLDRFIRTDLSDTASVEDLARELVGFEIFGFIHCASPVGLNSIPGWTGDFSSLRAEPMLEAFFVNVCAPVLLIQKMCDRQLMGENTSIVLMSSIYGEIAPNFEIYENLDMDCPLGYCAAKGALNQAVKWMASRLAPRIRINAIAPGGIESGQPEEFIQRYITRTSLKRMCLEQDVANMAEFLISDKSGYITGQIFRVDGQFVK